MSTPMRCTRFASFLLIVFGLGVLVLAVPAHAQSTGSPKPTCGQDCQCSNPDQEDSCAAKPGSKYTNQQCSENCKCQRSNGEVQCTQYG